MARVLVIEDDRFNRQLYQDLLEAEGLAVELVSSAGAGLDSARAHPPGLVVMDLELPDMDGVTATRALKSDPRTAVVPVLVVSAHAQSDQEARALGAGAAAFLRKPLRFPAFQEAVTDLLDQSRRGRTASARHSSSTSAGADGVSGAVAQPKAP